MLTKKPVIISGGEKPKKMFCVIVDKSGKFLAFEEFDNKYKFKETIAEYEKVCKKKCFVLCSEENE